MRYLKVGSGCASAAGVAPERPVGILPVQTAVDRLPKRQSCRDPKRTIYISQWDPVFTTRKKDKRHFPALPAGVRPLVLKEKAMRVGCCLPEKPDTSPTTVLERREIPQKHGFCKNFFRDPAAPVRRGAEGAGGARACGMPRRGAGLPGHPRLLCMENGGASMEKSRRHPKRHKSGSRGAPQAAYGQQKRRGSHPAFKTIGKTELTSLRRQRRLRSAASWLLRLLPCSRLPSGWRGSRRPFPWLPSGPGWSERARP